MADPASVNNVSQYDPSPQDGGNVESGLKLQK